MPLDPDTRWPWPNLRDADFEESSEDAVEYNCIAHAVGVNDRWWWPDDNSYWPSGVPRVRTIDAFRLAFATLGYQQCSSGELEEGLEKIAIYVNANGQPTHAAKQLPNGRWTSKLGSLIDIEHSDLDCLADPTYGYGTYGTVALFLSRGRA